MNITADKRGGHWPARASEKFSGGGGGGGGANPNPPIIEKKTSRHKKKAPPNTKKFFMIFLGGARAYSFPPCGHPFWLIKRSIIKIIKL